MSAQEASPKLAGNLIYQVLFISIPIFAVEASIGRNGGFPVQYKLLHAFTWMLSLSRLAHCMWQLTACMLTQTSAAAATIQ